MVNNKQTTDELNMSIFLSRYNHSVNALIVTLITQTRVLAELSRAKRAQWNTMGKEMR